ncbi:TetR/AcrR family transcriptional regulator [Paenibacillus tuaregi]|uniref:TetR/AcrR family transcriptional regulator n=1 Tax=Paenibacillus tuaregi TaxID=1816681 RepID=UPI000837DC32|nr:TetR/AcrR family transcriptional regulator [Paenibacillus tuaregi]
MDTQHIQGEPRERILNAAAELIRLKGFKAVTTKDLANSARVNESTIFRQFGNKMNVLSALIERFSYYPGMKDVYEHHITWNLREDLSRFATAYQQFMRENSALVLIGLKEAGVFPELDERIAGVPKQTKEILKSYLSQMYEKGYIERLDFEAVAMSFIWMNLGHFLSKSLYGDTISLVTDEEFIGSGVRIFADGLQKGRE